MSTAAKTVRNDGMTLINGRFQDLFHDSSRISDIKVAFFNKVESGINSFDKVSRVCLPCPAFNSNN
uniref:Uncharacterized protein n=1 Tax=Romanomermis culicivorax TaxID=13658 RepID=A0A915K8X5_ROMCU